MFRITRAVLLIAVALGLSWWTTTRIVGPLTPSPAFQKAQISQSTEPISYYTFDTTLNDSVGSNHGSNTGTISYGTGKISSAVTLDGQSSINVGSAAALDNMQNSTGMTISAWIKPSGVPTGTIATKGPAVSYSGGWSFQISTGNRLYFFKEGGTDLIARTVSNAVKADQWQHVSVIWDGGTTAANVKFYVNGIEISKDLKVDGANLTSDAALNLYVGTSYVGQMDDLRFYNRQLLQSEIQGLYSSGELGSTDASAPTAVNAASCADADVQKAIDIVADQGVVLVPAGTCVWTTPVVITGKSIVLKGAGIGITTISDNLTTSSNTLTALITAGKQVRITGFTFDGSKTRDNRSIIGFVGPVGSAWFRADHNEFTNVTERAILTDTIYGLIDHNIFTRIRSALYSPTLISVIGDQDAAWQRPETLGTANAVYMEDNTFVHNLQANGPIDMYNGARYVFRHNTVYGNGLGHHGYDSSPRGVVSFEIYDNTFTNASPTGELYPHGLVFEFRSGSGLLFNNTVIRAPGANNNVGGYDSFVLLRNYRSGDGFITNYGFTFPWDGVHPGNGVCDGTNPRDGNSLDLDTNGDGVADKSSGYPCKDQMGRTSGIGPDGLQILSPVYSWNNNFQGVIGGHMVVGGYAPPPPGGAERVTLHIKPGRDYFNDVARPGYSPYVYPHPLLQNGFLSDSGGPIVSPTVVTPVPAVAVPNQNTAPISSPTPVNNNQLPSIGINTNPVLIPVINATTTLVHYPDPVTRYSVSPLVETYRPGDRTAGVQNLQNFLLSEKYLLPNQIISERGYYGSATEDAVRKFQKENGIITFGTPASTGYGSVGVATQKAINGIIARKSQSSATSTSATTPVSSPIPQSGSAKYRFSRNLGVGSRGEDVRQLQIFLNANGFPIATAGDGSRGKETTYYGKATAAAVTKFQERYRSDILAKNGLTRGNGYVGTATRAKIQSLMK